MKDNLFSELSLSIILLVLTILLLNPFGFWMPSNVHMSLLVGFIIFFILFASYIWKENTKDEREVLHRASSGRIAYLVGTGVLVMGILLQSLHHTLDPWLIIALVVMVLAKIISQLYSQLHN